MGNLKHNLAGLLLMVLLPLAAQAGEQGHYVPGSGSLTGSDQGKRLEIMLNGLNLNALHALKQRF